MHTRASILIVDENERLLAILDRALSQQGFHPILALCGRMGYLKALQYNPEVAILGQWKGSMDRLGLVRSLRGGRRTARTAIIARGRFTQREEVFRLKAAGVNEFLPDPFRYGTLLEKIERLLGNHEQPTTRKLKKPTEEVTTPGITSAELLNPQVPSSRKPSAVSEAVGRLHRFPVHSQPRAGHVLGQGLRGLTFRHGRGPRHARGPAQDREYLCFAKAHARVSDPLEAVVRLGFQATRNLAIGLSVTQLFDAENQSRGFDRKEFWVHSLATGLLAQGLAGHTQGMDPQEAFVSGILHDLGKMVLDEHYSEAFHKVLDHASSEGQSLAEAETAVLGVQHAALGRELLLRWSLPQGVVDAVAWHHDPYKPGASPGRPGARGGPPAKALGFGDAETALCRPAGHGVEGLWLRQRIAPRLIRGLVMELGVLTKALGLTVGSDEARAPRTRAPVPEADTRRDLVAIFLSLGYQVESVTSLPGPDASHGTELALAAVGSEIEPTLQPNGPVLALSFIRAIRNLPRARGRSSNTARRNRDLRPIDLAIQGLQPGRGAVR